MNGIIPLYKPKGLTSHDCVHKIRKIIGQKKVGHTGTLDPNVEGVLPICVGEATKIIPFVQSLKKTYVADIYLGKATTTEDKDGEIVEQVEIDRLPTDHEIERVLSQFIGEIEQKPPMYSAVKIKGKRLYEYARQNIEVERPVRKVVIYDIERYPHPSIEENNVIRIKVTCSKGTYIRTLCVDIGKALGFPAHMSYLLRTETDSITLEETRTFDDIERAFMEKNFANVILPIERVLQHLSVYHVPLHTKMRVLQGQKLPKPKETLTDPFVVMHKNELLAIYTFHKENSEEIKPLRVFNLYKNEGEST